MGDQKFGFPLLKFSPLPLSLPLWENVPKNRPHLNSGEGAHYAMGLFMGYMASFINRYQFVKAHLEKSYSQYVNKVLRRIEINSTKVLYNIYLIFTHKPSHISVVAKNGCYNNEKVPTSTNKNQCL